MTRRDVVRKKYGVEYYSYNKHFFNGESRADFRIKDLFTVLSPKNSFNCAFARAWHMERSNVADNNKYKIAQRFAQLLFLDFLNYVLEDVVKKDNEFAIIDSTFKLKMVAVYEKSIKTATMRLDVSMAGFDFHYKISSLKSKGISDFSLNHFSIHFPKKLRAYANRNVEKYRNVFTKL